MNGNIDVESVLGEGSEFSFSFDYTAGKEAVEGSDFVKKDPIKLLDKYSGTKVLVADDRADNRIVLKKLLEPYGFIIKEAVNGQEAVDIVKEWSPKIILLDIVMPVLDGKGAAIKIREMENGGDFTLIAVSASVIESQRSEVLECGVDSFICKPFNIIELLYEIKKYSDVEYMYESAEKKIEIMNQPDVDFSKIDYELRKDLFRNAVVGDIEMLYTLLLKVQEFDEDLGERLNRLIDDFELDKIKELFE